MFGNWVERFLEAMVVSRRYSENTIVAYRNDLQQFVEYMEQQRCTPQNFTAGIVTEYIEDLRDRAYASSTIARKVAAVKTFLSFLYEGEVIHEDISGQIDTPKVERQTQTMLTPEQVEQLLNYHPSQSNAPRSLRNRVLLELLYSTDMKINELVDLKISDFNDKNLTVRERGSAREIALNKSARKYLRAYLREGRPRLDKGKDDNALFLNHRGQALTRQGLWLIIKSSAEAVGLPENVTPHTLQRSFSEHQDE